MSIPIKCKLSLEEFKKYIKNYNFGTKPPKFMVIHHTWKPEKDDWNGIKTIHALDKYYRKLGWNGKGPHLFIADDGIWLFTPMYEVGIHAGSGNGSINHPDGYSLGIEVVGNYDNEVWSGETKKNALGVILALQEQLSIPTIKIKFHRHYSKKTCPGKKITEDWLHHELGRFDLHNSSEQVKILREENIILRNANRDLSNRLQKAKDFIRNI